MSEAKIMTPLFYDYNFNRQGKKIRAVVDRVVSNGVEVYSLWRRSGRPDYPEAVFDDDMYALSVDLNGYLVPIFHTHRSLVRACGEKPAVEKMFGSYAKREAFFDALRKSGANESRILEYCNQEEREIQAFGSDPARQTDYIKSFLIERRDAYLSAKLAGSTKFPDFVGAVVADDLDYCIELADRHRRELEEKDAEKIKKAREEKEAYCRQQNEVAEQKIEAAMAAIRAGGTIENEKITIYKTPSTFKTVTVVSAIMKTVGVEVPIRTKGWIERKLGYIIIRNGVCANLGFLKAKGCKCPEKIFDYLNQMVQEVVEQQKGAA